jgi:hypothetical protein
MRYGRFNAMMARWCESFSAIVMMVRQYGNFNVMMAGRKSSFVGTKVLALASSVVMIE